MAAFVNDDALHVEIAPHLSRAAFERALAELEHRGFPKKHPVFKGRYLPAVRRWLDGDAGLGERRSPLAPDGAETWGENETLNDAGTKAAAPRGRNRVVLERGGAVAEGCAPLPRPLDPFTSRRHSRGN